MAGFELRSHAQTLYQTCGRRPHDRQRTLQLVGTDGQGRAKSDHVATADLEAKAALQTSVKEVLGHIGRGAARPGLDFYPPVHPQATDLAEDRVAASEGARKLYEITTEGEAVLGEHREGVERIFARMSAFGGAGDDARPRIIQAARALKMALRQRLARGPIGEAETKAIVAALEALARDVERS